MVWGKQVMLELAVSYFHFYRPIFHLRASSAVYSETNVRQHLENRSMLMMVPDTFDFKSFLFNPSEGSWWEHYVCVSYKDMLVKNCSHSTSPASFVDSNTSCYSVIQGAWRENSKSNILFCQCASLMRPRMFIAMRQNCCYRCGDFSSHMIWWTTMHTKFQLPLLFRAWVKVVVVGGDWERKEQKQYIPISSHSLLLSLSSLGCRH